MMAPNEELEVLADLLDDPAFVDIVAVEVTVARLLDLPIPDEVEIPQTMLADLYNARQASKRCPGLRETAR